MGIIVPVLADALPRPLRFWDFTGPSLPPDVTFTRASKAWAFNSSGVLTEHANDTPRFDHDPETLAKRGLLIEEARTNTVANPRAEGASAGTPGTLPTGWSIISGGLTTSVVGTGTEDGMPYVDLRWQGTAVGIQFPTVYFALYTNVPAANGQTWSVSVYGKLAGGSYAGITNHYVGVRVYNNVGTGLGNLNADTTDFFTASALRAQRRSGTVTLTYADTAYVRPAYQFRVPDGATVDVTIRFTCPQCELGPYPTSIILPPAGAPAVSNRAVDNAVTPLWPGFNPAQGTLVVEAAHPYPSLLTGTPYLASINDGTANNRIEIGLNTPTNLRMFGQIYDGGVVQFGNNIDPPIVANEFRKSAIAFALNNTQFYTGGASGSLDSSCTIPTAVTQITWGRRHTTTSGIWGGIIARAWLYQPRLNKPSVTL